MCVCFFRCRLSMPVKRDTLTATICILKIWMLCMSYNTNNFKLFSNQFKNTMLIIRFNYSKQKLHQAKTDQMQIRWMWKWQYSSLIVWMRPHIEEYEAVWRLFLNSSLLRLNSERRENPKHLGTCSEMSRALERADSSLTLFICIILREERCYHSNSSN